MIIFTLTTDRRVIAKNIKVQGYSK